MASVKIDNVEYQLVPLYKNIQTGNLQFVASVYNRPDEFQGYMLKPVV